MHASGSWPWLFIAYAGLASRANIARDVSALEDFSMFCNTCLYFNLLADKWKLVHYRQTDRQTVVRFRESRFWKRDDVMSHIYWLLD